MSLYASGNSTGEVSLKELFDGHNEIAFDQARDYYDAVVRSDINRADNENTAASYINALRKIFVIEDMPAWNPNLRSKTAIRSSGTRYYVDSSIAVAALGFGPNDPIKSSGHF